MQINSNMHNVLICFKNHLSRIHIEPIKNIGLSQSDQLNQILSLCIDLIYQLI